MILQLTSLSALLAITLLAPHAAAHIGDSSALTLDASHHSTPGDHSEHMVVNCTLDTRKARMQSVTTLVLFGSRPCTAEGQFDQLAVVDPWSNNPRVANGLEGSGVYVSGQIGSPTSLALTWNSYTNLDHDSYKCAAYGIDEEGRAVSVSTTAKADWEPDAVSAELHSLATQIELVKSSSQENAKSLLSKIDTLGDATDEKMTSLLSKIETLNSKIDAIYRSSRVQSVLLYADLIKFDISDVYKDTVYFASKHEEPFNIKRANDACVAARGYLVELDDVEEYNFVLDFVKRVGGSKTFMTGGNDVAHEGKFSYYNSGNPVPSSLPWSRGQPDNAYNAEDCMEFFIGKGLNDMPCQNRSRFVCEVPLPSL